MRLACQTIGSEELTSTLKPLTATDSHRLGLLTSLDGRQLVALVLDLKGRTAGLVRCELDQCHYSSLTPLIPQAHWFERALKDLFGITPAGHPRLKSNFVPEAFEATLAPLRSAGDRGKLAGEPPRDFRFLRVGGEGVYEVPVGPIHAGVIEPAHFRLSCLGEFICNLELRLGFLHRGVERRLTEVSWPNARFVAEAASSDTAAGNALAHAIAMESLLEVEVSPRARHLRTLALEVERIAMHIADIGGLGVDLGFLGVAAGLSRLRGAAVGLADLLSGSRFMRGYICPGGVTLAEGGRLSQLRAQAQKLRRDVRGFVQMFLDNASVQERLTDTGKVSRGLARDFGLVGVAARASGIAYDARQHFLHGDYPPLAPAPAVERGGDALDRTRVRARELETSFSILEAVLDEEFAGECAVALPQALPANEAACGIVEAFRGELIHLIFTDARGRISRYAIKDPSFNNWTGMAIAARNNLIADFPVANKSFALSYSGHDL